MKFIADSMLGRLARWLRISGYDVVYGKNIGDEDILKIARSEGRILLSRDVLLYEKSIGKGVEACLVNNGDIVEQLRQLRRELGVKIKDTPESSRCPLCNSAVRKIEGKKEVPAAVRDCFDEFWKCAGCGKVYWYGGHWRNIRELVEKVNSYDSEG